MPILGDVGAVDDHGHVQHGGIDDVELVDESLERALAVGVGVPRTGSVEARRALPFGVGKDVVRRHIAGELLPTLLSDTQGKPSTTVARERHRLLWLADKAEAVFLDAARAVPRSQEMQLVHHVVMATHEGTIDPGGLDDR
jgi:hypothetical protein